MTASHRVDFGGGRRPLRVWRLSGIANTRALLLGCVALGFAAVAFALGVSLGAYPVPLGDVVRTLGGTDLGFSSMVVLEWRLPRTVAGLVFGSALGLSGAIFQSLTRNPLGSPDVIGLGAGAFTGALIAVLCFDDRIAITLLALAGGLGTAILVALLATRSGLSGMRFVIIGIAISAALTAVNSILMLRMSTATAMTANIWGQGTLTDVRWAEVAPISVCIVLCGAALVGLAPSLQQLELGDELASATGVRLGPARIALLIVGVLLTALVTSVTGPIAFVALVAPQLARLVTGSPGTTLLGAAATGALLLSASDLVAQHAFPLSVPVGIVTAIVGGAYLLGLILREAARR